jgi:hypothetical protein
MKQRIDTLVDNNAVIVTLVTKYTGYAKTATFKTEADKFLDHAIRYGDRWKTLIAVFAAKADSPTAAPVFPVGFPGAVDEEIAVRRAGTT